MSRQAPAPRARGRAATGAGLGGRDSAGEGPGAGAGPGGRGRGGREGREGRTCSSVNCSSPAMAARRAVVPACARARSQRPCRRLPSVLSPWALPFPSSSFASGFLPVGRPGGRGGGAGRPDRRLHGTRGPDPSPRPARLSPPPPAPKRAKGAGSELSPGTGRTGTGGPVPGNRDGGAPRIFDNLPSRSSWAPICRCPSSVASRRSIDSSSTDVVGGCYGSGGGGVDASVVLQVFMACTTGAPRPASSFPLPRSHLPAAPRLSSSPLRWPPPTYSSFLLAEKEAAMSWALLNQEAALPLPLFFGVAASASACAWPACCCTESRRSRPACLT